MNNKNAGNEDFLKTTSSDRLNCLKKKVFD